MTTKELAEKIGVSRITLSKVLNGNPGVAKATEEKIKRYIEEYNFAPNIPARSLAGKKERIIGFFTVFSNEPLGESRVTSHFASEFTDMVICEAQKYDCKTLVSITEPGRGLDDVERYFNAGLIVGAVLFGYNTGDKSIEKLAAKGFPLILVNQEEHTDYENVSLVNMNDEKWGYFAVQKLVELGHKRLLYVESNLKRLPASRRTRGVSRALEDFKDLIESTAFENADFKEDLGYQAAYKIYRGALKDEVPTGIIAANDLTAIGIIRALKELGYRVPDDVSVIGFDDIFISRYITPALTTVKCDFGAMAKRSVEAMIHLIEGGKSQDFELDLEFVERDTLSKRIPVHTRPNEGAL